MATRPQLTKLAIIRNQSGKTRQEWFKFVELELGRRIGSNRELSVDQASHLIEISQALEGQHPKNQGE